MIIQYQTLSFAGYHPDVFHGLGFKGFVSKISTVAMGFKKNFVYLVASSVIIFVWIVVY